MEGKIVVFRIMRHADQKTTNEFCKKFYGQETSSHGYTYRRKGLLDDIPHRKLIRGVLIFRDRDVSKVTEFLKSYGAEYHVRVIKLKRDDVKALSK